MRKMTGCTLISFAPDAHEVGTDPVEQRRKVKCQELSLTMAEAYQAGGTGLNPEAKLLIPYDRDYKGERALEYKGERWTVLRNDPYKDWNGVILTIRRVKGNAGDPTAPETAGGDPSPAAQDDSQGAGLNDSHGGQDGTQAAEAAQEVGN